MPFKKSEMHDIGERYGKGGIPVETSKRKKYYPTVRIDTKRLPALNKFSLGQILTVHAHGKVTGTMKQNNNPTEYTIELNKAGVKLGHNPVAMERALKATARKRGYGKERTGRYVYGTISKHKKRKKRRKGKTIGAALKGR